MMTLLIALVVTLTVVTAQKESWFNGIVDLSHYNGNVDLAKAKADGIVGVIHKATQGLKYKDSKYDTNKKQAVQQNLLWGAYHFGENANGRDQANHFYNTVGNIDLIVLDIETYSGKAMTPQQAEDFVNRIYELTSQLPIIYSNKYFLDDGKYGTQILTACQLWVARYGKAPVLPKGWSSWVLWQYTNGTLGEQPKTVKGIGACDRDKFSGSKDDLQAFWKDTNKKRKRSSTVTATPTAIIQSIQQPLEKELNKLFSF